MPRNTEELFLYHSQKARYYKNLLAIGGKDVKKTNIHQSEKDYLISFFDGYLLDDVLNSNEAQMVGLRAKYIHHMKQKGYTHQRIGYLIGKSYPTITYILNTYNADGTRKQAKKKMGAKKKIGVTKNI